MVEKDTKFKVLVTGAQGLLGSEVVRILSQDPSYIVKGANRQELDITNGMEVAIWLERLHPDFVINCAALSHVDYCETHPEEAFKVNSESVRNLCLPLEENGGKLIHISTDYVFDGEKNSPYIETDPVNPLSIYAESKLKGEEYVQRHLPDSLVVRVQWLYGERGKSFTSQFIRGITQKKEAQRYRLIEDRIGSPTRVHDIVFGLRALMEKNDSLESSPGLNKMSSPGLTGGSTNIFHVSSEGACSWVEFGKTVFELSNISSGNDYIEVVREKDMNRPAKRPRFTPFSCMKLKNLTHYQMPKWKDAVESTIKEHLTKKDFYG